LKLITQEKIFTIYANTTKLVADPQAHLDKQHATSPTLHRSARGHFSLGFHAIKTEVKSLDILALWLTPLTTQCH
jgi:hypothetical protein